MSCETSGSAWMRAPLVPEPETRAEAPEVPERRPPRSVRPIVAKTLGRPPARSRAPRSATAQQPVGRSLGIFHNTYYSFPEETGYTGAAVPLFDTQCNRIALVPQAFHDTLCVQGSGRLGSGQTVSFGKRDCTCAQVCPRTGQRICFEALDSQRFPWGRGALGLPITPFRTVAVDSAVIPLRKALFVPAFVGMQLPSGELHDGCFRSEDRGLKVSGHHIDVFAGSESQMREWNALFPTASGVEVFVDVLQCESVATYASQVRSKP